MTRLTLRFNEPLLREAVRVFVFRMLVRQLGVGFFVVLSGLVAVVAWMIHRHDRGWTVGFLLATILFSLAFMAMLYVGHYRNTMGRFRRMRSPEATLGYDEESIHFASELGSSTIPWSAVTEVWRHERFWLLLLSPSQFVTLPLDGLDEAAREFISRKTDRADA